MQSLRIRKIFSLYIPAASSTELRATVFSEESTTFGFVLSNSYNSEAYQYNITLLFDDTSVGVPSQSVNCFEWGKRGSLQFHYDKHSQHIQGVIIKIKLQHKVFDFRKIDSQKARIKVMCLDANGTVIHEGYSSVFNVLPKRRGKDDGQIEDEGKF